MKRLSHSFPSISMPEETALRSINEVNEQLEKFCANFHSGEDLAALYKAMMAGQMRGGEQPATSLMQDVKFAFWKAFSNIRSGEERGKLFDLLAEETDVQVSDVDEVVARLRSKAEHIGREVEAFQIPSP